MYYKRPQRKRFHHYLFPFFVIGLVFAVVILGWRSLTEAFVDEGRSTQSEKVFLSIEAGSAKAMTVGKTQWQNAPDKIYLYKGERVNTSSDGRATLMFFEDSVMRLNTNTEVGFPALQKKNDEHTIEVDLEEGDVWMQARRIRSEDSSLTVTTDLISVSTRGATLAITNPGTVYMIDGSAQVGVRHEGDIIKTFQVGVGQQFVADPKAIEAIERGNDVSVIFALSDEFKRTNWYRWNLRQNSELDLLEDSQAGDLDMENEMSEDEGEPDEADTNGADTVEPSAEGSVSISSPLSGLETADKKVDVRGKFSPESVSAVFVNGIKATVSGSDWVANAVGLPVEGPNDIEIEGENLDGTRFAVDTLQVSYDQSPPLPPVVTEPAIDSELESGTVVEIDDVEQTIGGTVSDDTVAVIVDDYRLGKYVPGSGVFEYYAKVEFGNLIPGDNTYKIIAEDKAGNQSEPTLITLHLPRDVIDESVETQDTASPEDPLPESSSSGGVQITAPNNGESFHTSETGFDITGNVPSNTDYVEVNDYRLSKYSPGDATFLYFADSGRGSLEIGAKNTYTVKAFDAEDGMIGLASITIDVESGSSGAAEITIPTSDADYETTLGEIVLGGTVGKWVTRVYVNNTEIKDYIPGSQEWRYQVDLSPGSNTFTVTAEKLGEEVGGDVIKITYQP